VLEGIEELRSLGLDITIQTLKIDGEMLSIDTYQDLEKISNIPRDDFTLGVI
jgi:CMP-2-keto-3-deoxyoctulosonic acid synthetase